MLAWHMQYVPALLPSPPRRSREEEEESLALVAIETNSLQLCCKVVRRRPGHASLSISRALPSLPCLEVWKQSLPPGPVCLTRYLLLGRKGPRVLPDSSLVFFPQEKVSQLYGILALAGECQNTLESCLFTSINL